MPRPFPTTPALPVTALGAPDERGAVATAPSAARPPARPARTLAEPRPPLRRARAFAAVMLALLLTAVGALTAPRADALPMGGMGGFDPGNIFSDATMFTPGTMTSAQIDAFVREKGAGCTSRPGQAPCLKDLRSDAPARSATKYCASVPARTRATIGQILVDATTACGVNPQVIMVMLQKEQGLLTTTSPTWTKLEKALGFRCPDFQPCDPAYAGIVNQIYAASSRLQEYGDPARGFDYGIGTYLISFAPYDFCGKARVTIRNRATAALYNYTPHTPNQISIDAGAGVVADDVCVSYGNRNVYRIFHEWFGVPNGSAGTEKPVAAPLGQKPSAPFRDVPYGSAFFVEISWMKATGRANGWADETYRPLTSINRDAMAAFLYRSAGSPAYTPPARSPFRDVTPRTAFYTEIMWAYEQGITTGWPDGTFRPLEPIKRDAMAAFLYRASGSPRFTAPVTSPFRDVTPRTAFYKEIAWTNAAGISRGWADGTYRPLKNNNRDAMAAFIYRWTL